MSPTEPTSIATEQLRNLVMTAFEQARARGNTSWQTMTTAVLKNRLLQRTDGRFDERKYGFSSMLELVSSMPDLLTVDASTQPRTVTLRADEDEVSSAALATFGPRARIRDDLWDAIMNYSADVDWVWDGERAVAASEAELDRGQFTFPTVTAAELRQWRQEFLDERLHVDIGEGDLGSRLRAWLETGAATTRLPADIKGPWNAELKRHVLERVTEAFEAHAVPVPADLVETSHTGGASGRAEHDVRAFVQACVSAMTDAELAAIPIPAGVAARISVR